MKLLSAAKYTSLYLVVNFIIGVWFITQASQYPEGPALFPTILGWGLVGTVMVHSAIEIFRMRQRSGQPTPTKMGEGPSKRDKTGMRNVITPVIIFAFVAVVPYLGLYPSIILFLAATLPLVGQKKWPTVLMTIIGTAASTYLVFDYALGVPLPSGTLF